MKFGFIENNIINIKPLDLSRFVKLENLLLYLYIKLTLLNIINFLYKNNINNIN